MARITRGVRRAILAPTLIKGVRAPVTPPIAEYILLESGDVLLLEIGDKLKKE